MKHFLHRKKKKSEKDGSHEKLLDENQDLVNMAMETDPFLLAQQQDQLQQQMFMFNMQPEQPDYMPYFDNDDGLPEKG